MPVDPLTPATTAEDRHAQRLGDLERRVAAIDARAMRAVELAETTEPAAPEDGRVVLWAKDDGAGKTALMARFPTGASIQLAVEP